MTAKIIVLAGQSNAVGLGRNCFLPCYFPKEKVSEYEKGYENVLINAVSHNTSTNGFVPVKSGLSHLPLGTFFGPEVGIAEALTAKGDEEKYFIVKYAIGAVGLCDAWRPPSSNKSYSPLSTAKGINIEQCLINKTPPEDGWCYNDLVALLHESLEYLKGQSYSPEIIGFCWMQGENDALDAAATNEYATNFKNLIFDFKKEFADYCRNMKIIDAGISTIWERYREINQIKQALSKELGGKYIDTIKNGLHTLNEPQENPDIYHYDSDSVIKLGHLFAQEILY